jgi:hypothetical protein
MLISRSLCCIITHRPALTLCLWRSIHTYVVLQTCGCPASDWLVEISPTGSRQTRSVLFNIHVCVRFIVRWHLKLAVLMIGRPRIAETHARCLHESHNVRPSRIHSKCSDLFDTVSYTSKARSPENKEQKNFRSYLLIICSSRDERHGFTY